MPLLGWKTVMFSDSQRLFWARECPRVISVTHTPPFWLNTAAEPQVHLCPSHLKMRELIVWQRSEWVTPTTAWVVPLRNTARQSCQTHSMRIWQEKRKKKKRREGEVLNLLQEAVFVFVFSTWLLLSHIGLSSKNQKHAESLQAAGWHDKRETTWPVWSR